MTLKEFWDRHNWKEKILLGSIGSVLGLFLVGGVLLNQIEPKEPSQNSKTKSSPTPAYAVDSGCLEAERQKLAGEYAAKIKELSDLPISYDRKEDRMRDIMKAFEDDKIRVEIGCRQYR